MTKGLEAFNSIKRTWEYNIPDSLIIIQEDNMKIIEKELKRLVQLEFIYSNCVIEGAKQKKILQIILEKRVNIQALIEMSYKEYNDYCNYVWIAPNLTKEEYDILKEVIKQ